MHMQTLQQLHHLLELSGPVLEALEELEHFQLHHWEEIIHLLLKMFNTSIILVRVQGQIPVKRCREALGREVQAHTGQYQKLLVKILLINSKAKLLQTSDTN